MSLRPKKRECIECKEERYIFSRGRCKICASRGYGRIQKKHTPKENSTLRSKFFMKHVKKIQSNQIKCLECSRALTNGVANVCHIVSKTHYPEVEFKNDNIIYLCWECHSRFDGDISKREEFKSFGTILNKFEKLLPQLQDSKRTNELNYLIEKLEDSKK